MTYHIRLQGESWWVETSDQVPEQGIWNGMFMAPRGIVRSFDDDLQETIRVKTTGCFCHKAPFFAISDEHVVIPPGGIIGLCVDVATDLRVNFYPVPGLTLQGIDTNPKTHISCVVYNNDSFETVTLPKAITLVEFVETV